VIKLANILKEITVNKPGSKFKVETYRDVSDGIIYAYTLLPIDIETRGGEGGYNFVGRLTPEGILVYSDDYDFDLENGVEWNKVKDYLNLQRIGYENIDNSTVFIPSRYVKIVKELNEITVNKPRRLFKSYQELRDFIGNETTTVDEIPAQDFLDTEVEGSDERAEWFLYCVNKIIDRYPRLKNPKDITNILEIYYYGRSDYGDGQYDNDSEDPADWGPMIVSTGNPAIDIEIFKIWHDY
jgi:hypothetical protein